MERYLRRAFLGQKQFSVEGLDVMIPMLDEAIELAAGDGAHEVVIGMAHRGRLNVLAHVVGRPYETILREFEGERTIEAVVSSEEGGSGDVKYHLGAQGTALDADRRHHDHARLQPEPPRGGRSRRRGTRAGGADRPLLAPGLPRPECRAADPHPRRRGVRRPGDRRRDAQPRGARGLLDRRHAPPDHEQPGRLHDRSRRAAARPATRATSPRASTSRSSTSTPTIPRPRSLRSGSRSPTGVASATTSSSTSSATGDTATTSRTKPRTPSRCSPVRSPTHPTVRERVRGAPRRRRRPHAGAGGRTRSRPSSASCARRTRRSRRRSGRASRRRAATRTFRPPRATRSSRPSQPTGCASSTSSCSACPTASRPTRSSCASSSVAATRSRKAGSTGARPRRSRSHRSSSRGSRSGSRARTPSAARSPTGTSSSTTRQTGRDVHAAAASRRRRGGLRDLQLAALGVCVRRLRVRLRRSGTGGARALGGPVRRLRQRRADHHRPVHRRRPVEVAGVDAAYAPPARTATRATGPSTRAPASSASSSSRHRRTSASRTARRRASTSTFCGGRRWTRRHGRSSS